MYIVVEHIYTRNGVFIFFAVADLFVLQNAAAEVQLILGNFVVIEHIDDIRIGRFLRVAVVSADKERHYKNDYYRDEQPWDYLTGAVVFFVIQVSLTPIFRRFLF